MRLRSLAAALLAALLIHGRAFAQSARDQWFAPQTLSDANLKVSFEVDSTWHLVKGKTSGISGAFSLADPRNPSSVNIEASFPVEKFDSDDSDRDEEMREVMASGKFPLVSFRGEGFKNGCTPAAVVEKGSCKELLAGRLTIRGVTLPVELPIEIKWEGEAFKVLGKLQLRWADYGVEDPSIFIARLHDVVSIFVEAAIKAPNSAR